MDLCKCQRELLYSDVEVCRYCDMEAKLRVATEALEFYSNKENYQTSGYGVRWFAEHGYKRAKLALEKIGGNKWNV